MVFKAFACVIGNTQHNPPIVFGTKGRKKDEQIREIYKNKNRRFYRWFAFGILLVAILRHFDSSFK